MTSDKSITLKDPINYSPISLLSSKLKKFHPRLMSFNLEKNVTSSSQFGLTPKKSCTTALIEFTTYISEAIDKELTRVVFF